MVVKCYYEILNVSQDASEDDLKKSYRKLALTWHPDKNLDNIEEAKEQFQLVQQAYEVLSDSQERAWYDKHRDSILRGGLGKDYNDQSLDIYPYFSTSCFKGYGDDERGFYAVYREVFNKLTAEEAQFQDDTDSEEEVPDFGDSTSDYQTCVHAFYSYWQSFQTKRSFSWLDEYDTRTAPNRRVARLMEKENKKLREAARKEKNEQIRTLVSFVRKRDKRVQTYSKLLEERAALNADKVKQIKLKQKRLRDEEIQRQIQTQSEWAKFDNFEQRLKEIEEDLTEDSQCESEEDTSSLYCSACNKLFRTEQAFSNHEKSKKHKDNVQQMMFDNHSLESPSQHPEQQQLEQRQLGEQQQLAEQQLSEEDLSEPDIGTELTDSSDNILQRLEAQSSKKNKKKKKNKFNIITTGSSESDNEFVLYNQSDSDTETTRPNNRKNRRKNNKTTSKANSSKENTSHGLSHENSSQGLSHENTSQGLSHENTSQGLSHDNIQLNDNSLSLGLEENKLKSNQDKVKSKQKKGRNILNEGRCETGQHVCKACTTSFRSNNELFKHLKKTGHAMPPSAKEQPSSQQINKKKKQ